MSWTLLRSEEGPSIKLFRVRYDWMKNPRNGHEEKMVVLSGNDSVQVVALTPASEIIMVRQYRFGIKETTLELPGGIIDDGETPQQAARRELAEETGYGARIWEYLGKNPSNPVFMDAYVHHFYAQDAQLTQNQVLDDGELIDLVAIPVEKVFQLWRKGELAHPHTVAGLRAFFAIQLYF